MGDNAVSRDGGAAGLPPPPRRRWRLKWQWWVAIAAVAVPTVPLLTMWVLARCAEAGLERARGRIVALGVPLDIAELAKPPVPDEENAALVYQQAFGLTDVSDEDDALAADIRSGDLSLSDPAVAAQARDILERNGEALALVRRAAGTPRCNWSLDWSKGIDLLFPHFAQLRNGARLLALEGMMQAHDGHPDEALATYSAMLRMSNAADEPCLIGQLVRYAIVGIASAALEAGLADRQPSEDACRAAAKDIAQMDLPPGYVDALRGECAMGVWCFRYVQSEAHPWRAVRGLAAGSSAQATQAQPSGSREPPRHLAPIRWWFATDEATYLELMAQTIEQAELPHREAVKVKPSIEEQVESLPRFPPRTLTTTLLPVYSKGAMPRDRAIAALGVDQIALLLKAYKARHGRYPATLEQLQEYAGYELPVDPFWGEAFGYRREGDGFLIYSWGPNLKDDGGQQSPTGKYNEGDIVFRCPA